MDGDAVDGVFGGQQVGGGVGVIRGRWTDCCGGLDETDHYDIQACACEVS